MAMSLRSLLAPPVFDDDDKTRVASVLKTILLWLIAAALVYAVMAPLAAAASARRLLIAGLAMVVKLAPLFMMRHGYVRLAGAALNAGLWVATTGVVVAAGGVGAPVFGAYAIVVVTAGVLLGWRAALGFAGLSTMIGLALLGASDGMFVSDPFFEATNMSAWLTQAALLAYTTVVICAARRSVDGPQQRMRRELAERRRAEVDLRESEERYARLVDAAFEGIGFCENNIIFDANARLADMLSYTPAELIGKPTDLLWSRRR